MSIQFSDLETAYEFVSSEQPCMHSAYLCRDTGLIYFDSELGDFDELPDDIDDFEKYIAIPHQRDLNLGSSVALDFVAQRIPDRIDYVQYIFSRKGAYHRFKNILESQELLEEWYKYEDGRVKEALKAWCEENSIEVVE